VDGKLVRCAKVKLTPPSLTVSLLITHCKKKRFVTFDVVPAFWTDLKHDSEVPPTLSISHLRPAPSADMEVVGGCFEDLGGRVRWSLCLVDDGDAVGWSTGCEVWRRRGAVWGLFLPVVCFECCCVSVCCCVLVQVAFRFASLRVGQVWTQVHWELCGHAVDVKM
jgi:hypothetical protein